MRTATCLILLLACAVATPRAVACDCAVWHGDDVFERSTLLFVGRALPYDWDKNQQGYEVILTLKGKTHTPQKHLVDFGDDLHDCLAYQNGGSIVSVAITDRSPIPSTCDGSANLLSQLDEAAIFLEKAGAQPATLSGATVAAVLEPKLKDGQGDAWFVGNGPVGETLEVAGRKVHVVDAIDGTPAGEVFTAGQVIQLRDVVYVELAGQTIPEARALVRVPVEGDPELLVAFWKGGRIRIPEPTSWSSP